eukprot:107960-Prymnesium_polylepis.2
MMRCERSAAARSPRAVRDWQSVSRPPPRSIQPPRTRRSPSRRACWGTSSPPSSNARKNRSDQVHTVFRHSPRHTAAAEKASTTRLSRTATTSCATTHLFLPGASWRLALG